MSATPPISSSSSGSEKLVDSLNESAPTKELQRALPQKGPDSVGSPLQSFNIEQKNDGGKEAGLPVLAPPKATAEGSKEPLSPALQQSTTLFFKEQILFEIQKEDPSLSLEVADKKRETLLQALQAGSPLNESEQKIINAATATTSSAWSLPASWHYGSKNSEDWTPVVANASPPSEVNLDQGAREWLGANIEGLCSSICGAADRMMEYIPADSPKAPSLRELSLTIMEAMSGLREVLHELQMRETKLTTEMADARSDRAKQQQKDFDAMIKKQQAMEKKKAKSEKKQKSMGVASIVISVVVIAIGIIALPFTFGASAALIIAGLAVSSTMLAYTILDQQFGLTSQAIGAFNQTMENLFPDKGLRDAMKGLILGLTVLILCAAVAASPGSAASFGTEVAAQTARMLVIQTSIMFLMSSNIASDVTVDALISSGAIKKNDENAKMITEIVMMVFTMILSIGVMTSMGPGSAIKEESTSIITRVQNSIKAMAKTISNTIKQTATAMQNFFQATQTEARALFAQFVQRMNQLLEQMQQLYAQLPTATEAAAKAAQAFRTVSETLKNSWETFQNSAHYALESWNNGDITWALCSEKISAAGSALKNSWNSFCESWSGMQDQLFSFIQETAKTATEETQRLIQATIQRMTILMDSLPNFKDFFTQAFDDLVITPYKGLTNTFSSKSIAEQDWARFSVQIQDTLKLVGIGVEAYGSITIGGLGLEVARMLKELGKLEEAQEVIRLLIKLFDDMLNNFQQGITGRGEEINSLTNSINTIFAKQVALVRQFSA